MDESNVFTGNCFLPALSFWYWSVQICRLEHHFAEPDPEPVSFCCVIENPWNHLSWKWSSEVIQPPAWPLFSLHCVAFGHFSAWNTTHQECTVISFPLVFVPRGCCSPVPSYQEASPVFTAFHVVMLFPCLGLFLH